MGRLWCEKMPLVSVPQSDTPKRVTFIIPYYDNPQFLSQQLAWWSTYPAHLRSHLSAIIVDDGSPIPAASVLVECPFPIRLFRIHQDVRWNWLAARNIGFHHASDGWCLVTDIDHVIPETTATALVYGHHELEVVYAFSRIEHTGEKITPHSASFLMTRQMFWTIGGYDEELSGFYGTDGEYRRRLAAVAPIHILTARLIRHEYQGDSSTSRYLRKQPEDAEVKRIVARRPKTWRPKVLSFPYAEVMLEKEAACP